MDFSLETKTMGKIIEVVKEKYCQLRVLYSGEITFKNEGEEKTFSKL
jgi:hypothetical protein